MSTEMHHGTYSYSLQPHPVQYSSCGTWLFIEVFQFCSQMSGLHTAESGLLGRWFSLYGNLPVQVSAVVGSRRSLINNVQKSNYNMLCPTRFHSAVIMEVN